MSLLEYLVEDRNYSLGLITVDLQSKDRRTPRTYELTLGGSSQLSRGYSHGQLSDCVDIGPLALKDKVATLRCETHYACRDSWIECFHRRLQKAEGEDLIYLISTSKQLNEFLDFYYSLPVPKPDEVFPFLHGLTNFVQRRYFLEDEYSEGLSADMTLPNHFHTMFVCTKDSQKVLPNLCSLDDILTLMPVDFDGQDHVEYIEYEPLDHVGRFSLSSSLFDNRNFASQQKIAASMSNFVVFNDSADFLVNLNAAKTLKKLSPDKSMYIVDIPLSDWVDSKSSYIVEKPVGLFVQEQSLLRQMSSMKNPMKNIYSGNTLDYQILSDKPHTFYLIINAHDKAQFPDLSVLEKLMANNGHFKHIYLEFPCSGMFDSSSITFDQTLSFLNFLKLIYLCVSQDRKVLIFSRDGFTGQSLLLLAIGCLFKVDNGSGSLEEIILKLMSQNLSKFHFFKRDLVFLKKLERFIAWVKEYKLRDTSLISELNYELINLFYSKQVASVPQQTYDWFNFDSDNNFPSKVLESIYVGSVSHASSFTVINNCELRSIISIGEKPLWLQELGIRLEHEPDILPITKSRVVKPAFVFNNGKSILYVILLPFMPQCPRLSEVIYVYNLKDDGKDSMLPLLLSAPQFLQDKIIPHPTYSGRTMIHCQFGVSRSVSLAIALFIKHKNLDLRGAYLLLRVTRYNVIAQPNLRLFYELFYYEYMLKRKTRSCWWSLCQEIAQLNSNYLL